MGLIKLYILTATVLLAAEVLWLRLVARDLFRSEVGHLMRSDLLVAPAAIFYLTYVAGILVFAVLPGLEFNQFARTLALGGFLGFLSYSTFDLTAMALFRDFPLRVAGLDIAWGTVLTAAVSSAGYGFGRWLGVGS